MCAEADIQGPIMTVESFLGDNELTFLVACFSTVEQPLANLACEYQYKVDCSPRKQMANICQN